MRRHDFSQRYCKSFAIGRRQTGMSVRSHGRVTPVQHNHAVCRAAYAPHPHRAKRSGLDRVLCGSDVPCLIRRIEDSSVKKGAMLRSRRDGPGSSGASVSHREPSRPASSTNQRQASCGRPRRSSFWRAPRRLSLAGTITRGAPRRDRAIGNFASFSNIAHLLAAIGCGSGERKRVSPRRPSTLAQPPPSRRSQCVAATRLRSDWRCPCGYCPWSLREG